MLGMKYISKKFLLRQNHRQKLKNGHQIRNPDQQPKIHTSMVIGIDDEGNEVYELLEGVHDRFSVYKQLDT